jgi:peptidoglycan-associated lipoprotein
MKRITVLNLFVAGLVLIFGTTACHKKPTPLTHIPGSNTGPKTGGTSPMEPGGVVPGTLNTSPEGIEQANRASIEGRPQNREMFAAETVYFDVDSASVKSSQKSKLESVAQKFKAQPAGDLLIEGHCDERGTEGYNLTLGDKRANSLREYLANLGVSPDKIHTLSLGESKPAATGNDESAWSKNRRGEFIFVEPAK